MYAIRSYYDQLPSAAAVAALLPQLAQAQQDAKALVEWVAELPMPDDHQSFVSVALHADDHYAMNEGQVQSTTGLRVAAADYRQHFHEHQEPHSTALYSLLDGDPYLVGPLARLNLNFAQLPEPVRALAAACGLRFPSDNMYMSLAARALECYFAVTEARSLLEIRNNFV